MGELEKLKIAEAMKDSLEWRAGFIYGKMFVRVRDVKKKKEKKRIND